MSYLAQMPAVFPYRAAIPTGPGHVIDLAMNAASGRLAVTESDAPGRMWVWARTRADASAASAAMPALVFGLVK